MEPNVDCAYAEVKLFRPNPRLYSSAATGLPHYNVSSLPMTFEAFYQQEYCSLLGLAYVLVGPHGGAEDLTQEAFTRAHQQWDDVRTFDNPKAWLRRVLVNQKNSNFRRLNTEHKTKSKLGQERMPVIELGDQPEEVWAAVRALPERQAQVIALRFWNDLTIRQIAETLDCGTETVKTHLSRARTSLAKQLDGQVRSAEARFGYTPAEVRRDR